MNNPFPAEAVATFGASTRTCTSLEYMLTVQRLLNQYLTAHAIDASRYGAAIGLRGGHGSGKTHVLAWVAESVGAAKSIRGAAIYGKCDSSRYFDLCVQLLQQVERSNLIELIQLALLSLARRKVQKAKVTESLVNRLENVGGLQLLQNEQNIDLEELRQELLRELQERGSVIEIARVLIEVPDPVLGADAYEWLVGNDIEEGARLGVTNQARALPVRETMDGAINSDIWAITALESVAALHEIASVPLLVLVDQLEVLLRTPDATSFQTSGSLTKKFVEQLTRQSAAVFIAGVPEAWDLLMRDVSARFRQREQIVVGSLSLPETRIFLEAYTQDRSSSFNESAIGMIRQLSGGSPREILRICHYAYEKSEGNLATVNDGLLLESARSSGSISDRAKLALAIIDSVLPSHGQLLTELTIKGERIDRALVNEAGNVMAAVIIFKATDPLDEIDSARRLQVLRHYCQEHWPDADLVVVMVGYSSADVRLALTTVEPPLLFDERTFAGDLRMRLVSLIRKRSVANPGPSISSANTREDLERSLKQIAVRLAELEKERAEENARIQQRFSEKASNLAVPAVEERKLSTRREVLDALDSLRDALESHDRDQQKKVLRTILVANEAYLSNATLEDLGELYLETLALERTAAESPEADFERIKLLQDMRDSLRRDSGIQSWFRQPSLLARVLLGLFGAFVITGVLSEYQVRTIPVSLVRRLLFLVYPYDFITFLPFFFGALTVVAIYALGASWALRRSRGAAHRRRMLGLRYSIHARTKGEGKIWEDYPQA